MLSCLLIFAIGVESYEVSLEKQEVLVNGTIEYDALLEKIKKTGKEVCLGLVLTCSNLNIVVGFASPRFALEKPSFDVL